MTCPLVLGVVVHAVLRWLHCTRPTGHDGLCRFTLEAEGLPLAS